MGWRNLSWLSDCDTSKTRLLSLLWSLDTEWIANGGSRWPTRSSLWQNLRRSLLLLFSRFRSIFVSLVSCLTRLGSWSLSWRSRNDRLSQTTTWCAGSWYTLSFHGSCHRLSTIDQLIVIIRCSRLVIIIIILVVWVNVIDYFLFFFITLVVNMLLILNIELAPLQIYVIDIEVIFVQLHVDHLLSLLIHFILFQALVDLIDLVTHLRLVFDTKKALDLRLRCVEYLTRLDLMRLLIAQVEIHDAAANLD